MGFLDNNPYDFCFKIVSKVYPTFGQFRMANK